MRFLTLKKISFIAAGAFFFTGISSAQEGQINLSQDPKIDKLLTYKTEINQETDNDNRYRIQIFNGNRQNAEKARSKFQLKHRDITTKLKFETPNYKVWVGNFRSSLEADRFLVEVKKIFPNAFSFIPPKKKKK
ncbi:SPOR domain-containing protein [uncultured Kordia sp.]|uniref:SPOR domain-containing protein n=1 Tax=uncultured Kordia sp. TaxID=507699 RepID=UPI002610BAEB|nr:SPOR domain-containing protein [uncultured Kordia sp.]